MKGFHSKIHPCGAYIAKNIINLPIKLSVRPQAYVAQHTFGHSCEHSVL